MLYKISNKEEKTSQTTGKQFTQVTLTNEQGEVFEKINLFNGEATGKTEVEGDLVQNGQYWNFKAKVVYTANIPNKGGAVMKAMERKEESIAGFQESKEKSIALAGSITNATHIVTALMEAGMLSQEETGDIKKTLTTWIAWYQEQYKGSPSKQEAPF